MITIKTCVLYYLPLSPCNNQAAVICNCKKYSIYIEPVIKLTQPPSNNAVENNFHIPKINVIRNNNINSQIASAIEFNRQKQRSN